MRVLLLASHAVAEYDDVRMFSDLGYDVFAPGGYEVPSEARGIRPALPDAPHHPELVASLHAVRHAYGDPGPLIDAAKARLPDDVIDWSDTIIVHHFPERWIAGQWERIRGKRVIWRTCGQSSPELEQFMAQFHRQGLQIVRYSPCERTHFERGGAFAGEDAMIRFGKDPSDFLPWIGDNLVVGNVTQNMVERAEATGLRFWQAATEGLPVRPAGPGSEALGGYGEMPYHAMLDYLRHLRAYLYTGTVPASYTLGLIEAMMAGVPVVSIGEHAWQGPDDLFEGPWIVSESSNEPHTVNDRLWQWLHSSERSIISASTESRRVATRLFGVDTIRQQWADMLGAPVAREAVTA